MVAILSQWQSKKKLFFFHRTQLPVYDVVKSCASEKLTKEPASQHLAFEDHDRHVKQSLRRYTKGFEKEIKFLNDDSRCVKRGKNSPIKPEKGKEEKMAALAGGIVALILGIIGIVVWWGYFVKALAAGIPVLLILGGALATYLGIEEWKDKKNEQKSEEEPDTSELKQEVKSLKKEVEELKKEE